MSRVTAYVLALLCISSLTAKAGAQSTNCDSVHVTREWDKWKLSEPQWVQTTVNTWEGLADAICQAQGSKLPAGGYQCDGAESRPPTAMQITLTADLSLRGRRLPDIWGDVKLVGACGGAGKRCAIHAVSEVCSSCDTIWDVNTDQIPLFDHCNACSEAPLSVFRYDNTPLTVRNSGRLWLQHLELAGAHSSEAGGILKTVKGTSGVWDNVILQGEMTYVYAEDVMFKNGFSAQQGGAAMADQGTLMIFRSCEFVKNFAGPDMRDREYPSAHDVSVANYAKVLVEDATPASPEVRLQSLIDMDRELGECIIARGIPGELLTPAPTMAAIPSPPPPPVTDLSEFPNVAPDVKVSDDTWLVVIIACCAVGGTILLLCVVGIMCCMSNSTEEERELPTFRRVQSVASRHTSSMGLARLFTVKPRYVKEGDMIASLAEEHQEAERARRDAERRAERAEKALRDKGYKGGFGTMSFGRRMFESIKSFGRMVSVGTSKFASRFSNASGFVSTPVSPKQKRVRNEETNAMMKSQQMDESLPNQPITSDVPGVSTVVISSAPKRTVNFDEA